MNKTLTVMNQTNFNAIWNIPKLILFYQSIYKHIFLIKSPQKAFSYSPVFDTNRNLFFCGDVVEVLPKLSNAEVVGYKKT